MLLGGPFEILGDEIYPTDKLFVCGLYCHPFGSSLFLPGERDAGQWLST